MPIEHPPLNEQENYPVDLIEELKSVDYEHVDSGIYDFRRNTLERKDSCLDWIQFETQSYTVQIVSQFKKPHQPTKGDSVDTRVAFHWKLKDSILEARIEKDTKKKRKLVYENEKLEATIITKFNSKKILEVQGKRNEEAKEIIAKMEKILDEITKLESELNKHEHDKESKSKWVVEEDAVLFPSELWELLEKFCYRNFTYLIDIIYSIDE